MILVKKFKNFSNFFLKKNLSQFLGVVKTQSLGLFNDPRRYDSDDETTPILRQPTYGLTGSPMYPSHSYQGTPVQLHTNNNSTHSSFNGNSSSFNNNTTEPNNGYGANK